MTAPPLTHHDILELVAPFSQRGLQVDLLASDRLARRLVFKPRTLDGAALGPLHETLTLESHGTGTCLLTRSLATAQGQRASLAAMGPNAGALLQALDGVPAQGHFRVGRGYVISRSYALEAFGSPPPGPGAAMRLPLRLTQGTVQLDGLTLLMSVSGVRGVAADWVLQAAPGKIFDLPEDLLAVLGWDWARLLRNRDGWTSRMRLRGDGPPRSARAEAALDRAAEHLAHTLSQPPAQFHDQHLAARWGVVLRRAIPVLTPLSLLLGLAAMPPFEPGQNPGLALLLYHVPTVTIAISFCLQELPRFEIPPLPRRALASSWQQRPVQSAGSSAPNSV